MPRRNGSITEAWPLPKNTGSDWWGLLLYDSQHITPSAIAKDGRLNQQFKQKTITHSDRSWMSLFCLQFCNLIPSHRKEAHNYMVLPFAQQRTHPGLQSLSPYSTDHHHQFSSHAHSHRTMGGFPHFTQGWFFLICVQFSEITIILKCPLYSKANTSLHGVAESDTTEPTQSAHAPSSCYTVENISTLDLSTLQCGAVTELLSRI